MITVAEIKDDVLDLAETQLIIAIREGKDWAIRYYLDQFGQERGYNQRKLAFKDGEGNVAVPAVLITSGRMSAEAWTDQFGHLATAPSIN